MVVSFGSIYIGEILKIGRYNDVVVIVRWSIRGFTVHVISSGVLNIIEE